MNEIKLTQEEAGLLLHFADMGINYARTLVEGLKNKVRSQVVKEPEKKENET
jgi:hypothetical protein